MAVSGPIARSIEDLKVSFNAMSRPDFYDPWYMPVPLKGEPRPKKVALCLSPDGMKVSRGSKKCINFFCKIIRRCWLGGP
jgi:amidase